MPASNTEKGCGVVVIKSTHGWVRMGKSGEYVIANGSLHSTRYLPQDRSNTEDNAIDPDNRTDDIVVS